MAGTDSPYTRSHTWPRLTSWCPRSGGRRWSRWRFWSPSPETRTPELEAGRPPERRLWPLLLLGLSLGIGSALRIWMATHDDGVFWPDEIYQGLEPAHRLIFGYGIVAWEFQEGARNWAFPGFIALVLKGCQMLGVTDPRTYVMAVRAVFCLVGVATAAATYQLARSLGA